MRLWPISGDGADFEGEVITFVLFSFAF